MITATFHHTSGDVIDLAVTNGHGPNETIGTTSNHPFWSMDREEYVQAGSLEEGEHLQSLQGDTKIVVSNLPRPGPKIDVYNLEVHAEHTYFVGNDGVLVHNAGPQYSGRGAFGRDPAPNSAARELTILNREFIPDTQRVLQNVTNQAVGELASNPAIARDLMSAGSCRHLIQRTGLADASYGKAVERLAADIVARDESLSSILRYQSRPFVSTPDFFGYEGYNLRLLDITTPNSIPRHLTRPYGPATDFITHPGLPGNLVFPR